MNGKHEPSYHSGVRNTTIERYYSFCCTYDRYVFAFLAHLEIIRLVLPLRATAGGGTGAGRVAGVREASVSAVAAVHIGSLAARDFRPTEEGVSVGELAGPPATGAGPARADPRHVRAAGPLHYTA